MVRLVLASCAAVAFFAPPALAYSSPVTATLTLQLGTLPPALIAGSGVAVVNGSGNGSHLTTLALPAGMLQTAGLLLSAGSASAPVGGILITAANAAGSVMNGAGAIPLSGFAKVCLFGFLCNTPAANLSVPLSAIGNGGTAFVTAAVNLTAVGAPWTTGTVAVGALTEMGFARGPGSLPSSTALPSGQILLVTPVFVSTNIVAMSIVPTFAFLSIHFVPEPTTLALIGGGLGLLAAVSNARRHHHRSGMRDEEPS